MNLMIGRALQPPPEDDYIERQEMWLDSLTPERYAELARSFFAVHANVDAWEAFMRDTRAEFELSERLAREL